MSSKKQKFESKLQLEDFKKQLLNHKQKQRQFDRIYIQDKESAKLLRKGRTEQLRNCLEKKARLQLEHKKSSKKSCMTLKSLDRALKKVEQALPSSLLKAKEVLEVIAKKLNIRLTDGRTFGDSSGDSKAEEESCEREIWATNICRVCLIPEGVDNYSQIFTGRSNVALQIFHLSGVQVCC